LRYGFLVDLYFLFDGFEVDTFLECFLFFVHFHVGPVHGKDEGLSQLLVVLFVEGKRFGLILNLPGTTFL
jgi:hypothetical protein